LNGEQTNVSRTISVLILRVVTSVVSVPVRAPCGPRNVGLFTVQPLDLADNPKELHCGHSPGKRHIVLFLHLSGGQRPLWTTELCINLAVGLRAGPEHRGVVIKKSHLRVPSGTYRDSTANSSSFQFRYSCVSLGDRFFFPKEKHVRRFG